VALILALAMLVAGETVLKGRLDPSGFLIYWLVCFALTLVAIGVAFLDVRALQHVARKEQQELLQKTIGKVELEARERTPGGEASEE
jgi:hypothetical protein